MSRFGFIGPSYTAKTITTADEECINLMAETNETPGAQAQRSYLSTPGLTLFSALPDSPVRGSIKTADRVFTFASDIFYELMEDGTYVAMSPSLIVVFGEPVSMAFSTTQVFICAGGRGYCFTLADNSWVDVSDQLAGQPKVVDYGDGYFIVTFRTGNKFQISDILDGTVWPGIQVNEVSVFPENIRTLIVSHRELWIVGERHMQPYQNTGTDEIYDPIPGTLVEKGGGAAFGINRVDNTIFWVSEDERGARQCWRATGYTPQRISTHAVEVWLAQWAEADFENLTSYAYQDGGHEFWVLYVPNSDASFVYDVAEAMWHKRQAKSPEDGSTEPHWSWNHVYAWGKHLVGDWKTGNLYEMKQPYDTGGGVYAFVQDNGQAIVRVRRSPTLTNELNRVFNSALRVQFAVGLGPQPPLTDGNGNPRPPQAMLRWSDDSGRTWSSQHIKGCGFAGQYQTLVRWLRLGQTRYGRIFELTMSDPIPWTIVDAYLDAQ